MSNSIIERTDFSQPRISQAARSLSRYFQFEYDRLKIEKRLFNEQLQKESSPKKIAEFQQALKENNIEWMKLHRGWQNSSIRRKVLGNRRATADTTGVEQRGFQATLPKSDRFMFSGRSSNDLPGKLKFTGYAAIFDSDSQNLGGFKEQIAKGAFSDCVKEDDVRLLLNHDSNFVLARTANKSLRLYEDKIGLKFYADAIPDDELTKSIARRIARKDLSQCSFSFIVDKDRWVLPQKKGDLDVRIIEKVDTLFDCAIVTFPAYLKTSCTLLVERSLDEMACDYEGRWDNFDGVEIVSDEKMREIDRGYRKAQRIINRNKVSCS